MQAIQIAKREVRIGFRNPWAYSFLALFSVFSLALLLIQAQAYMDGYTHTTGAMLTLILYLLPLMTILLGSFSITTEKEEGSWQLLSTYPLSTSSFLVGKYLGLALVLLVIISFGYGLSGVVGLLFGKSFSLSVLLFFFMFSLLLVLLFLGIAIWIGTLCQNRWQALTVGVSVWFLFILAWPTLLIAILGWLPYPFIKPAVQLLTILNPAELVRIFMVVKMGGGSIFGPEYYQWVTWLKGGLGTSMFYLFCLLWVSLMMVSAILVWERRRYRG
ncbi:ABC transporter permease [Brevibacillus daliensis]|uniref:ABC transporter permease n=1 Tax=Brevibacillus daliensis TaxID=2892995 RepID=UPI001E2FC254|nr:ABC transporter permease [Brevibacillus daliensis]